jgi:hypothetical protein
MARALKNILSTATKKKPKKRATSLATLTLGDEPTFICEPSRAELVRALNWYTQCSDDPEQHKAWVGLFMADHEFGTSQINVIKSKIKRIIPTYIYLARMFQRGVPLPEKYRAQVLQYFNDYIDSHANDDLDDDGNPVVKAPTRIQTNVGPLVEFIEMQIDGIMAGEKPESVYTKLQAMGCNSSTASQLRNIFKNSTQEFSDLSMGACEQLDEAYSNLNQRTRKNLHVFMQQLNDDLTAFAKVVKATRKPRKKKPVKLEKIVGKVRFQAQSAEYKIASLQPEKIIGALWLWTFNTKYRILAWYEAAEGGLSVKGTSVTNYKASGQKKLRKPEQQLAGFTSGAVKALPKNFSAIKTAEVVAAGRLNTDTILLRVF